MLFDFHTHTIFSDGVLTPDQLISLANDRNIDVISVTDHDTISNFQEVKQACNKYELELIKGTELTASLENKDIHILCYFEKEDNYLELSDHEATYKQKRIERLYKICDNLKLEGVIIEPENILKKSSHIIARPQIAAEIVEKGYASSVANAFDKYLYDGAKSYEPASIISAEDLIIKVRLMGGLPVLAHPAERFINREDLIKNLVTAGLQGIEVHHPSHDLVKRNHYTNLCRRYNLVVTGGSDYHGIVGKEDNLGKTIIAQAEYDRLKVRMSECSV
ncbi:MAG: PHP domain-containing protein [Candidatus Sericytochromatia bacterium]|nr:PHP domain-containing protein [Candidatus Sericytochromatia bacterium]